MESNLKVLAIVEVVLNVNDLPKMRDFYIEKFGFPLQSESEHQDPEHIVRPGEPTICFLRVASSETPLGMAVHPPFLVLIDYERHALARNRFSDISASRSTFNHVAFEVSPEDFDSWKVRLENFGLEVHETTFPNVQARAMFVRDPEGNSVELICQQVPDTSGL